MDLGPNRARMELLDILPSATAWAELSWTGLVSEAGTEAGLGLVETKSPNSEFRPAEICDKTSSSKTVPFNSLRDDLLITIHSIKPNIIQSSPSKSLDDALLGTLGPEGVEEAEPRESPRRSVSRVLELFTRPTLGLAATDLIA